MKKYSISTQWSVHNQIVQGSTNYDTLPELFKAYQERKENNEDIVRIGLSLDFCNSLNYKEREQIKDEENVKIVQFFKDKGLDILNYKYRVLTFNK